MRGEKTQEEDTNTNTHIQKATNYAVNREEEPPHIFNHGTSQIKLSKHKTITKHLSERTMEKQYNAFKNHPVVEDPHIAFRKIIVNMSIVRKSLHYLH